MRISNDYEIASDAYQWILSTRTEGKTKEGVSKDSWVKTYHPTIEQCCRKITDDFAKKAIQEEVVDKFEEMVLALTEEVKKLNKKGK
jgi:hypothetical protein